MKRAFYAHIDKIETDHENVFFEFHCMNQDFGQQLMNAENAFFIQNFLEYRDIVINLGTTVQNIQEFIKEEDLNNLESEWIILHTNKDGRGLLGQFYLEQQEEVTVVYIDGIERLSEGNPTRQVLENLISLESFKDSTEEEIVTALQKKNSRSAEFVAIYNVGQGNCNAICSIESIPLLYFDLGGGCYANKRTYPFELRFCFSYKPSILLSHWDTDHYQSAKLNPEYLTQTWIVPRQKIGPIHLKFFLSLRGNKFIWPDSLKKVTFFCGTVIQCTGPKYKKNHSGLAMSVTLKQTQNNTLNDVLLSADAAYAFIPGINHSVYDAIVATHHGAEFDYQNTPVPMPKLGRNAIVYSFGNGNTYCHPKVFSIKAHRSSGWSNVKFTKFGHIAISDSHNLPTLPCGLNNCDLQIQHKF